MGKPENTNKKQRRPRTRREPKTPETAKTLDAFLVKIAEKVRQERESEPSPHTLTAYRLAALKILEATPENPIKFSTEKRHAQIILLRAVFSNLRSFGLLPEHLQGGIPGLISGTKIKVNKDAQKNAREEKWIKPEDFKKFVKCFPLTNEGKQMRRFCQLIYVTGLRKFEAMALQAKDITIEKTRILVKVREGKGKKGRVVVVSIKHRDFFTKWKPFTLPIWKVSALFCQAREKAGNSKWTIHGLRHSFASNFATVSDDIYALKEMLGHSDLSTTMIYNHARAADIKNIEETVDKLPSF